jgi:voltage-gated sodium channel
MVADVDDTKSELDMSLRARLARLVTHSTFQIFIMVIVVANAATLGLETYRDLPESWLGVALLLDKIFLAIFVVEIALKLFAFGGRFFRDGWNIFDLVIVLVALLPNSGPFAVFRVLRVLRAFRLISAIPSLRKVVEGLLRAVPGLGGVLGVMIVVFYIGGVVFTTLYGETFPGYFGTIGASMMTLFQLMLFDGWGDIVREVNAVHSGAWAMLLIHTVISGFAAFNLIVAVMVDGLVVEQSAMEEDTRNALKAGQAETQREIDHVEVKLAEIEAKLDRLLAQSAKE